MARIAERSGATDRSLFSLAVGDLHFQGMASCLAQTLVALEKMSGDGGDAQGSVFGRVWRDVDGNHRLDADEQSMGNGVPGVAMELYECPSGDDLSSDRVMSTVTSFDGSYLLEGIPPGSYYVEVTVPYGYHLSSSFLGLDGMFDNDFNPEGKSDCFEFTTMGGSEVGLDAGLIPARPSAGDASTETETEVVSTEKPPPETETELVSTEERPPKAETELVSTEERPPETETELISAAVNNTLEIIGEMKTTDLVQASDGSTSDEEEGKYQELDRFMPSFSAMHNKARSTDRGKTAQSVAKPDETAPPPIRHSKSSLQSPFSSFSHSSYAGTVPAMVSIAPADVATIHSDEAIRFVGGSGELLVGPQSSWQNDVLLKFDLKQSALGGRDYRAASRAVLRLYALASSPSGGAIHFASPEAWDKGNVKWSTAPDAEHVLATIGNTFPRLWVEPEVTGMLLTEDGMVTLRITSEEGNHSWMAKYSAKDPAPELQVFF